MRFRFSSLTFVLLFLISPFSLRAQVPEVLADGVSVNILTTAPYESVKLSFNPQDSTLYILGQRGSIYRVNFNGNRSTTTEVQNSGDHGLTDVQGMDISTDGRFFIVGNIKDNQDTYTNVGVIKRATVHDGSWNWETVASTEPWPISNTDFDHVMNEIVVSANDSLLYVNSGSRTDHGEEQAVWGPGLPEEGLYPGLRETPLTAKILSIPADTTDLILENDIEFLRSNDFIFAEGTRNSFGMALDGNGELFSADNAGQRDDPGEFNWLRKGRHYGFPWRIGGNDTPSRFEGYDPAEDKLILPVARNELFYYDENYPDPPEGIEFTEPIKNYGPDAVYFKDEQTGTILNAANEDTAISSFTPHRSSLGLVFDRDSALSGPYTGDGFILGFTGGILNEDRFLLRYFSNNSGQTNGADRGEDLLHLELTRTGDTYEMTSIALVRGFLNPIDSEMIGDKIYVLEFQTSWLNNDKTTRIWEVSFPVKTANEPVTEIPDKYLLKQNYPNPFNPSTVISYQLSVNSKVSLRVFDMAGRVVATLEDAKKSAGLHQVTFDASGLSSGVYMYQLKTSDGFIQSRKMILIK